nr:MAG TPA: Large polyvalent protein associated domain 29 [Caudoviricetes sp.]
MKYFKNITTPEELKKQFRALSIKLHPDRPTGNAEEFKAMMTEYNNIMRNFEQAKERAQAEAETRRQAEEYAQAEAKRKAEEEEAARKAAEAMRPVIAKWSAILERVPEKKRYSKPTAAYSAAVKRNIKAVFAKYFPGVKVSVTLNNKAWSEKAQITWTDGPTVEDVEKVAEFRHFVSSEHVCDPYADYGDDVEITYNKAWREAFGEIEAQRFEFVRDFSEFGKAEVLEKIREILPQFVGVDDRRGTAKVSESDTYKLVELFGFLYKYNGMYKDLSDEEREAANRFDCDHMTHRRECFHLESSNYYGGETPINDVIKLFRSYYTVSASASQKAKEEADAPKFAPVHNATYKAVVKALGGNFFAASNDGQEWSQRKPITPTEAAELLAKGVRVDLVKAWESYDNSTCISGVNAGGRKTQEKRAAKFAAVGFTAPIIGQYKDVYFTAVSAEVLAELRKDAESVEEQRKAWEAAQREGKTARKATAKPKAKAETAESDNTEAPAEGLELVEIPGGVAVVGGYYDTLRNRKAIKAHGARWNKEAKQWQATEPEAVARLREWFGVAEPKAEEPKAEEQAAQGEHTHSTASEQEQPKEPKEQPTAEEVERVTRFAALLADVIRTFEEVATAAQREAQRAKETATKQAEAEQLRADIAKMSAQVAKMTEALRMMAERLDEIDADNDTSNNGTTADNETQPENEDQERPERGEGKPDPLGMLRAAAEDVARLTAANDHTAALLARLYVLAAVGLRVRSLIQRAKAIEAAQQRGHLTPDEVSDRQRISQETERRAALLLTPEEFRTLYGYDPKTDRKAA